MTGTNTNGDPADLGGSSRVSGSTWELRGFGHASQQITIKQVDSLGYFEHQDPHRGLRCTSPSRSRAR